jgi:hypothetical protein
MVGISGGCIASTRALLWQNRTVTHLGNLGYNNAPSGINNGEVTGDLLGMTPHTRVFAPKAAIVRSIRGIANPCVR